MTRIAQALSIWFRKDFSRSNSKRHQLAEVTPSRATHFQAQRSSAPHHSCKNTALESSLIAKRDDREVQEEWFIHPLPQSPPWRYCELRIWYTAVRFRIMDTCIGRSLLCAKQTAPLSGDHRQQYTVDNRTESFNLHVCLGNRVIPP